MGRVCPANARRAKQPAVSLPHYNAGRHDEKANRKFGYIPYYYCCFYDCNNSPADEWRRRRRHLTDKERKTLNFIPPMLYNTKGADDGNHHTDVG